MRRKLAIAAFLAVAITAWSVVRHLKQRGLDVELIKVSFAVQTEKVVSLLLLGADPRARYGSSGPDHFADRDGGYPVSADQFTALLALAHSDSDRDRVPIARALLAAGADINADDGYGDTALAECCYMNREALALYLIESGANPNTKTGLYIDGTYDIAPVHRATQNPRVLKALIEHGADLTVRDSAGRSPLDWAMGENDQIIQIINETINK